MMAVVEKRILGDRNRTGTGATLWWLNVLFLFLGAAVACFFFSFLWFLPAPVVHETATLAWLSAIFAVLSALHICATPARPGSLPLLLRGAKGATWGLLPSAAFRASSTTTLLASFFFSLGLFMCLWIALCQWIIGRGDNVVAAIACALSSVAGIHVTQSVAVSHRSVRADAVLEKGRYVNAQQPSQGCSNTKGTKAAACKSSPPSRKHGQCRPYSDLEGRNSVNKPLQVVLLCMMVGALVVLLGLTLGSTLFARGLLRYPARGEYAIVTAADGTKQHILYHCEGAPQKAPYTFVLESDATHGLADFWPLQADLTRVGLRSCIFDKLGLGHSSSYQSSQVRATNWTVGALPFYHDFMSQLRERETNTTGLALVGWGGGGENIFDYARNHPEFVKALVFLDVASDNVEWQSDAYARNLTTAQMNSYKQKALASRSLEFMAIRGVLAPFGLLGLVMPANTNSSSSYPLPSRFSEYHWNYLIPRTWSIQWYALKPSLGASVTLHGKGLFDVPAPLLASTPLLHIVSDPPASSLCPKGMPAQDCVTLKRTQHYILEDKLNVSRVAGPYQVSRCTAADCNLSMAITKPGFIAETIAEHRWDNSDRVVGESSSLAALHED